MTGTLSRRELMIAAAASSIAGAQAAGVRKVRVLATFSILGDIAAKVGGDDINVRSLVGPNEDAHLFQPRPGDVRAMAAADIIFANGFSFEPWLGRTLRASKSPAKVVFATQGVKRRFVKTMHSHGHNHGPEHDHAEQSPPFGATVDPHAWQSAQNGEIYARNIEEALSRVDVRNATAYAARGTAYRTALAALHAEARGRMARLPRERRKVVIAHDAFGYFADAYGLTFIAPVGLSTDGEPNAGDIARLVEEIRREKIRALFVDNTSNPRLLQQIARETGVKIGRPLYSDALSEPNGPAPTYTRMFRHNLDAFNEVLSA
jgi:zinc/manganese transport system substrate-binding protein